MPTAGVSPVLIVGFFLDGLGCFSLAVYASPARKRGAWRALGVRANRGAQSGAGKELELQFTRPKKNLPAGPLDRCTP